MWQPSIDIIEKTGGKLKVRVVFDDGTEKVVADFLVGHSGVDWEWLRQRIQARLDELNAVYTFADNLQVGPVDLTPPLKPSPSADDEAKAAFSVSLIRLHRLLAAANCGVIATYDARIKALQASLQSDFDEKYLDLFY